MLGNWMTTCLGKSCSFGLPRVPFVNCCQFMCLVISLLFLRSGCGIWLYQFLIIAYLFTLPPHHPFPAKLPLALSDPTAKGSVNRWPKLPIKLDQNDPVPKQFRPKWLKAETTQLVQWRHSIIKAMVSNVETSEAESELFTGATS